MKKSIAIFILIISIFLYWSSLNAETNDYTSFKGTISYKEIGRIKRNCLFVERDIDLHGKVCNLPKGVVLVIDGGIISNGTLIGNQTVLKYKKVVFDSVRIEGSWNVSSISTSMFANLSYENALKDVVALAHPDVQNTIIIEEGDYCVVADDKNRVCLDVPANTTLIVKGTLRLRPNSLTGYDIIRAKGENIAIKGYGTIVGDKHTHLGKDGEWGMGVALRGAVNASISDITINNCWGDCIYVGGNSKKVRIENCLLNHGRRQGISVTSADSVDIRNCRIADVGGANPEYAIDLEPNKGDTVNHVVIDNVEMVNCAGGLGVTRSRTAMNGGAYIGDFTIKNCIIRVNQKYPIKIRRFLNAIIEKCVIYTNNEKAAIHATEANRVIVRNNRIIIGKSNVSPIKNGLNNVAENGEDIPLHFQKCRRVISEKNTVVDK